MGDMDLSSILLATEQLASDVGADKSEDSKVNKTLKQVLDSTNKLWSKVSSTGFQDTQANLLLSSKGVDLPYLSKKLETITSQKAVSPAEPFPITDISSFLNNEKETAILSIIEETHNRFDKALESKIKKSLEEQASMRRDNLLSLYDISDMLEDTPFPQRLQAPSLKSPLFGISIGLDQYQLMYAETLGHYNMSVVTGKMANVVDGFTQCMPIQSDQKLKDIWQIVSYMSDIPSPTTDKDVLESRSTQPVVDKMIYQAKCYLQERYKMYMENVVSRNVLQSLHGGQPGFYGLVQSFVKTQLPSNYESVMEKIYADGLPFWPICYYALRCGDLDTVSYAIERSKSDLCELSKAMSELKKSPSHRLTPEMSKMFQFLLRSSADPFKRVVYCILGCYGIREKHAEVIKTADDYLWLQLCLVEQYSPEIYTREGIPDAVTYSSLQIMISEEYGESYFNAVDQPHVYFQMLFLTGQFEAAIDFLFRNKKYYIPAVHIAVALNEKRLLALPDDIQKPFLSATERDKKPAKRLNLYTLVKMYVRIFQEHNPDIAFQYYFCLRNVQGTTGDSVLHELATRLVLETEQYDKILGYVEPDGCRVSGFLENFAGHELNIKKIAKNVATVLAEKGRYYEAVKLYDLSGNFEELLSVTNNVLSYHLKELSADELKLNVVQYTEQVLSRNKGLTTMADPRTVNTFNTLHSLYKFFYYYEAGNHEIAFIIIRTLGLVPLKSADVELKSEQFIQTDPLIARIIGDVLSAVVDVIVSQYEELKGKSANFIGADVDNGRLANLRESARAIVSFAGRIPFQLPGEVYNKLMQLEPRINK